MVGYIKKAKYRNSALKGYIIDETKYFTPKITILLLIYKTLTEEERKNYKLFVNFLTAIKTNPFIKEVNNNEINNFLSSINQPDFKILLNNVFFNIYINLYFPNIKQSLPSQLEKMKIIDNNNNTTNNYSINTVQKDIENTNLLDIFNLE